MPYPVSVSRRAEVGDLCRSGSSFPVRFDHQNVIDEALPADLALIPVLAPKSLTEPDVEPTANCHEFVTWPVPRCGVLKHAYDSHRFLECEIVSRRSARNDFAKLITELFDLCELHVFGDLLQPRHEILYGISHHRDYLAHPF